MLSPCKPHYHDLLGAAAGYLQRGRLGRGGWGSAGQSGHKQVFVSSSTSYLQTYACTTGPRLRVAHCAMCRGVQLRWRPHGVVCEDSPVDSAGTACRCRERGHSSNAVPPWHVVAVTVSQHCRAASFPVCLRRGQTTALATWPPHLPHSSFNRPLECHGAQ